MFIKGVAKEASELALGLILEGFSYDDLSIKMIVEDKGIGIENIDAAKEPLFSTKFDEERAGLGFTIMEVFTDSLQIESELGFGTKVTMIKYYGKS